MRARSQFALFFLLFVSPLVPGQAALRSKGVALELRLAKTRTWHDHYLEITVTRVNHSRSRVFLPPTPFEGIEMYASVTRAVSTLESGGPEDWILVYGWSDLIEPSGKSLAPGSKEKNTYYISDTFLVIDTVTNATRPVRLQGKLRILARYEQRNSETKVEKHQRMDSTRAVPTKEVDSGTGNKYQAVLEIQIPCPPAAASPDCLSPPPVFPGEHKQWPGLPTAPVL